MCLVIFLEWASPYSNLYFRNVCIIVDLITNMGVIAHLTYDETEVTSMHLFSGSHSR